MSRWEVAWENKTRGRLKRRDVNTGGVTVQLCAPAWYEPCTTASLLDSEVLIKIGTIWFVYRKTVQW